MDPKKPIPVPPTLALEIVQDDSGQPAPEIGGRKGPDPTRYNDWEKDGKCVDF